MHLRGPDAEGLWIDEQMGIGLGHARLSVLDPSDLGNQPMTSSCGRFVISYNGEVYNYRSIAQRLQTLGHQFLGGSDTEVVIAAVAEWGIEKAIGEFVGMFAFALWDRQERELVLCRDRLGIKPLYFGLDQGRFVFASELKPFRETGDFDLSIDRDALTLLLRHNYIPAPYSIFKKVAKLRPGHILRVTRQELEKRSLAESRPFWELKQVIETRGGGWFEGSPEEAREALDDLLRKAIQGRMISDVPLGAFLSGGIDSSTVVALMQAQAQRPVKTFSIGFEEEAFNEAVHAAEVARHLGTEHTQLYVNQKNVLDIIPKLPSMYDEPFSDSSQIPTFLVSELARRQVTVSLSGDGADELFGGYDRYARGERIGKVLLKLPGFTRELGIRALTSFDEQKLNQAFEHIIPGLPKRMRMKPPGSRAHRLAELLALTGPEQIYCSLISHWKNPAKIVIGATEPLTNLTDPKMELSPTITDFRERMMYLDLVSYLPDDILTKVDRASMGVSLEARVPFLDHRIVEFAWSLPMHYKVHQGEEKWILRQVLERYVPKRLFDRPKMGFSIPIGDWLKGDLRDWAEDLLDLHRLQQEGYFEPNPIRHLWEEHLAGRGDPSYALWDILMFQAWRAEWKK